MPDYMIDTTANVFEGIQTSPDRIPIHARNIYEQQSRVGWKNYSRGRIVREWGGLRTTNSKGILEIESRWRAKIIKIILKWLHRKWILRCEMCSGPEAKYEHKDILEECLKWWED